MHSVNETLNQNQVALPLSRQVEELKGKGFEQRLVQFTDNGGVMKTNLASPRGIHNSKPETVEVESEGTYDIAPSLA